MNKFLSFSKLALVAASSWSIATSQAALIVFEPAQTISGALDVSTAGTLDRAFSFQIAGNVSPIVNGVAFEPTALFFDSTTRTVGTSPATVTLSVTAGIFNSTTNSFAGTQAPFTSLDANYQALLSAGVFYDNQATNPLTMTLNNLIVGAIYEVQVFVNDSRPQGVDRFVTLNAGSSVNLNFNTTDLNGGLGQHVSGTFTADSATQAINFLGGSASPSAQINAMQLRLLVVPEPGVTALLLGGGFLAFVFARRGLAKS